MEKRKYTIMKRKGNKIQQKEKWVIDNNGKNGNTQ